MYFGGIPHFAFTSPGYSKTRLPLQSHNMFRKDSAVSYFCPSFAFDAYEAVHLSRGSPPCLKEKHWENGKMHQIWRMLKIHKMREIHKMLNILKIRMMRKIQKKQKPEFFKINQKIQKETKKQYIFSENTGEPLVFSIVFCFFLDFLVYLEKLGFCFCLNFLGFWVSWPVA